MQEPSPQGDSRSDAELIDAVRLGDPAAYGVLFERHSAAVTAMARYYARDNFTADDLVSEAFERTFTVMRGGGGPDVSFRAYIYTAVRRLAYEQTERARKTRVTDDFSEFEMPDEEIDTAVNSFERTLVTGAFATLPERWQAVLWYLEVEGMSPPEVAPLLGLTANGVSALAYRAREGLREAYLQAHIVTHPTKVDCEEVRGKLGAFSRGGLSKRDEAKVRNHLDTCDDCTAIVAELGDVGHGMRVVIGPLVLGGAAAAGLGWGGAPSGTASAATLLAAPRGLGRAPRIAATAASAVALALIATAIVFALSPGPEASDLTPVAEPVDQPELSRETPSPSATAVRTPSPSPTEAPPGAAPTPSILPTAPASSSPTPTPTVTPAPQLELAMADVGDLVLGRDGMVGVSVTNSGDGAASAISIALALPGGVTIDGERAMTVDGASVLTCYALSSGVECTSPTLAAGAAATVYVPVVVALDADTSVHPSASISATGQPTQVATAALPVVSEGLGTRFIVNGRYASVTAGASFVSCDGHEAACQLARDRTADVPLNNNDWAMVALDEAGTGSVSSTTTVTLPPDAEVAFAGLYWSAITHSAETDATLAQVQLITPGGVAHAVTADRVDHAPAELGDSYQSYADVTDIVASGGAGTWAASGARVGPGIAAVPGSTLGEDVHGGWSLVVVYKDARLTPGRVTVFDGFESVTHESVSFVVAGIPHSQVTAEVVAWEGDAGKLGDSLVLDGTYLTRATGSRSLENAFDSTAEGSSSANSFGLDAGAFLPVPLAAARAVLTATTSGDFYTVGAVTVTTR